MTNFKRIFSIFLTTTFIMTSLVPVSRANAAELGAIMLPTPGIMVTTSPAFSPVMLKGLHIDPKDPLVFDFLVSKGEAVMDKDRYIKEVERLSRFFLASMTIPENELWVNLSPFEKEKITTDSLSRTEMGQHMLAQDYLLKQLTASMLYPEKKLGKEFWAKVYEQAKKQFGSVDMPVNTFNKVWILADTANAIEKDNAVFITDAHLKVMLEEDFLALKRNQGRISLNPVAAEERIAASNIIRQIILPEIEKEVNTGANFAPVRQIFNAFVLSTWYKKALKTAILNQVYADKSKMGGIESSDTAAKQKIYDQYIQAYKKGVFNYIKEETNDQQRRIPRKYFSGGMVVGAAGVKITAVDTVGFNAAINRNPGMDDARVRFQAEMNKLDLAMTTSTGMIEALYDAPRTSTTTKYIAMAERKAPALEAFLKKAGIEYTSYSKVKVKVQNQNMPFTAILQDGTVYLSSEFLKLLEESTSRFDFDRLGRELIQVVVSSSEKDRYWAQILWAREKLSKTKQLAKLIDIEGMIKEISAEFVGNQILETMTQELKDAVGPILAGSIQVQRELKLKDYTIAQEGTSKIIGALEKIVYQLAVNRMNGELIKYATPKVSKDDP